MNRSLTPSLALRGIIAVGLLTTAFLGGIFFVAALPAGAYLAVLSEVDATRWTDLVMALGVGVVAAILLAGPGVSWTLSKAVKSERQFLLGRTAPPAKIDHPMANSTAIAAHRLAAQFDVPMPAVLVRKEDTPLAYTTHRPDDPLGTLWREVEPVVVVSDGLLDALDAPERDAVLAHEIAHVANADLDVMSSLLLPPLYATEELYDPDETHAQPIGRLLTIVARVAIGVFSRGREFSADAAAARATGSPGALASALVTLDDEAPQRPSTDLREHAGTASAVNIVPIAVDDRVEQFTTTHPPIEDRIERLHRMTGKA